MKLAAAVGALALVARAAAAAPDAGSREPGVGGVPPLSALEASRPRFVLPEPGSYDLPVIDVVADHPLVEAGGRTTTLYELKANRLAIVSFIYTSCGERQGCPLANAVLFDLDRKLAKDPALRDHVTLLSISFDPARDTPEHLAAVRGLWSPKSDWRFATASDPAVLEALLADFMHPIARQRTADGSPGPVFRHVLKVYLLDPANRVRNIYSAGFLSSEILLNDLRTLMIENRSPTSGLPSRDRRCQYGGRIGVDPLTLDYGGDSWR